MKRASGTRTTHSEMTMARSGGQTAPVARTMTEKMKATPKGTKPQSTKRFRCTAIGSEGLVDFRKAYSTKGSASCRITIGTPVKRTA